ncbi:hypothetical protein CHU98_g644 [Xylaria longipes]|nr:hypothetical protein CHU98_g644 [Xylaria longipes]
MVKVSSTTLTHYHPVDLWGGTKHNRTGSEGFLDLLQTDVTVLLYGIRHTAYDIPTAYTYEISDGAYAELVFFQPHHLWAMILVVVLDSYNPT